jgi:hypothetical protein
MKSSSSLEPTTLLYLRTHDRVVELRPSELMLFGGSLNVSGDCTSANPELGLPEHLRGKWGCAELEVCAGGRRVHTHHTLAYGDLSSFFGGLEAKVGSPNPEVQDGST